MIMITSRQKISTSLLIKMMFKVASEKEHTYTQTKIILTFDHKLQRTYFILDKRYHGP